MHRKDAIAALIVHHFLLGQHGEEANVAVDALARKFDLVMVTRIGDHIAHWAIR